MYVLYMDSTETNVSNRSTTVHTPNSSSVVTTSSRSTTFHTPNRQTIINTLAVVGFIALIGASMWLAVYSTRFVPGVVSRLGTAAVYLGSVFTPAPTPSLSVVSTASSTIISFGNTSSTTTSTSTASTAVTPTQTKKIIPTAGQETNTTQQIGGTTATGGLSGLPDLVATINAVGYLTTTSSDSFVASTTVPSGGRAAVHFTIKNIGTNVTGPWRFSATIPTSSFYLYQSQPQQSLAPGDSIDYTLGFDQATPGTDKMISVTANFDHTVTESTTGNNSASAKININY